MLLEHSSQVKKTDLKKFRSHVLSMVGSENSEHQVDQACIIFLRKSSCPLREILPKFVTTKENN
jgi:hypothetical protein